MYDAATNTLYRYTPPAGKGAGADTQDAAASPHEVPTVAKIEEAIAKLSQARRTSPARTPTDVAGQPAYTARVSPNESGSLIGGAELSWDAVHGVPLRAAAVLLDELLAGDRTGGKRNLLRSRRRLGLRVQHPPSARRSKKSRCPAAQRAAKRTAPAGEQAEGHQPRPRRRRRRGAGKQGQAGREASSKLPEGLPKVKINGATASELPTAARHAAQLRALRRALPARRLGDAGAIEAVAEGL